MKTYTKFYCKFCRLAGDDIEPYIETEKKLTRKLCPRCGEVVWIGKKVKHEKQ